MKIPDECSIMFNDRIINISHISDNRYILNGETKNVTFFPRDRIYNVKNEKKSLNVFIKKIDVNTYEVWIKHHVLRVILQDHRSRLMTSYSSSKVVLDKTFDIKAPMPGLVVKMMAKKGEYVRKGDELMILEAMKMENKIISKSDGNIMSILVKQGEIVEKDQTLLTIHTE